MAKKENTIPTIIDTPEALTAKIAAMKEAQKIFATFTQEQVDKIFYEAAKAANQQRIPLAKMAVAETGMGVVEDKVIKNNYAAEYIYNAYKNTKTCGVIEEDKAYGIKKIAEPIGLIAAVIPTTNPTSTAIFKTLIALKTRNAIIISPHPRAKQSTIAAAKIVLDAAVKAGAPENIIGWIDVPSLDLTQEVMKNSDTILATGGPGMVHAAYSSGKPALGVGAGNTQVIIDDTADIKMAVSSIIHSKTFDNGMICASEQSVVVVKDIYDAVKEEFITRGAYFLNEKEKKTLGKMLLENGHVNADIVGQRATTIAQMAGIKVPSYTKVLIAEVSEVGSEEPFSAEKLSPVLAMYKAENFDEAAAKAKSLVMFGGAGHTAVLYTNPNNHDRITHYGELIPTARIIVNSPSSQGALGDLYNFILEPSLTLGCGSWGGNSVSGNLGVKHLMNIKTIAMRQENMLWFKVPPKVYFKAGCLPHALRELKGRKKAFIITDKPLFDLGYTRPITDVLEEVGISFQIFSDVHPDPDLSTIHQALDLVNAFQPDVIIALGGGSPIDAAKIVWLMYEHPELKFEDMAMRFMDIRKRIFEFPEMGQKAYMVAVPTTSGTGSEVTSFAVITDDATGVKYPIADYALTPNMAIVDANLVLSMPKGLCAAGGIDALVHSLEAIASTMATEYTNGLAFEAIRLIFKYLPASYNEGSQNAVAREKIHHAATMAGMAFANAFLGLCHSMAHKLGAKYHIAHGIANALLLTQVMRFNASDHPFRQAAFSQYKYPSAKSRYARVAEYLNLGGSSKDEKLDLLIEKIEELKKTLNIPASIKEMGIDEKTFEADLDELSVLAFDDQCTGANPRYPLVEEIKQLYRYAYKGVTKFDM